MTISLPDFIARWQAATLTEHSAAQSHFTDLCELLGQQKPAEADPRVEAIAQAARELVEKRDARLNPPDLSGAELKKRTLTNLYNARPTWLDLAHKKLDRAVLDVYGWPYALSDEGILTRLHALNLERASSQSNGAN